MALGGVPASITGTVSRRRRVRIDAVPRDRAGLGIRVGNHDQRQRLDALPTADASRGTGGSRTGTGPAPAAAAPPNPLTGGSAIVQKVPVGSDGTFTLDNVPSPNVYQLVVVKTGYATTIQQLDVAGGEQRTGVQLTLRKGDGLISGTVSDAAGALAERDDHGEHRADQRDDGVADRPGTQGHVHPARPADTGQLHAHRDRVRPRRADPVTDPRSGAEAHRRRRSRSARRPARSAAPSPALAGQAAPRSRRRPRA